MEETTEDAEPRAAEAAENHAPQATLLKTPEDTALPLLQPTSLSFRCPAVIMFWTLFNSEALGATSCHQFGADFNKHSVLGQCGRMQLPPGGP